MGFVVDKVAMGQVSSDCFHFPYQHTADGSTLVIIHQ
jgi:hypothetical protein